MSSDGSALVQNWIDEDIISYAIAEPNEVLVIKVFLFKWELQSGPSSVGILFDAALFR